MKFPALALALLVALPSFARADGPPMLPTVPYDDEGPFVVQPARILASPVYGVGFLAGAMVCLPISLVQQGSAQEPVPREKEASLICGKYAGVAIGWPVYAAIGLPFYILKKGFWDFPKFVAHKISPPPPEAAPAPAPASR